MAQAALQERQPVTYIPPEVLARFGDTFKPRVDIVNLRQNEEVEAQAERVALLRVRFTGLQESTDLSEHRRYFEPGVNGGFWTTTALTKFDTPQSYDIGVQMVAAAVKGIFDPDGTKENLKHLALYYNNGEIYPGIDKSRKYQGAEPLNRLDGRKLWVNETGPHGQIKCEIFRAETEIWAAIAEAGGEPKKAEKAYGELQGSKFYNRTHDVWEWGLKVDKDNNRLVVPAETSEHPRHVKVGTQLAANLLRSVFDPKGAGKELTELRERYYDSDRGMWPESAEFNKRGEKVERKTGQLEENEWQQLPVEPNFNLTDQIVGDVILPARQGDTEAACENYQRFYFAFCDYKIMGKENSSNPGLKRWREPHDKCGISRDPVYMTKPRLLVALAKYELGI